VRPYSLPSGRLPPLGGALGSNCILILPIDIRVGVNSLDMRSIDETIENFGVIPWNKESRRGPEKPTPRDGNFDRNLGPF
jgi:hypothetical protein